MGERSILKERNEAIVEAFYKKLRVCASTAEAFSALQEEPAPRFYVSRSMALRVLSAMRKGLHLPIKDANRKAMYKELYRRWSARSFCRDAEFDAVLNEQAPSYYLSPGRFKGIVYNCLRNGKKK